MKLSEINKLENELNKKRLKFALSFFGDTALRFVVHLVYVYALWTAAVCVGLIAVEPTVATVAVMLLIYNFVKGGLAAAVVRKAKHLKTLEKFEELEEQIEEEKEKVLKREQDE